MLRKRGGGRTPLPARGQVQLTDTLSLALGEDTRASKVRRPRPSARTTAGSTTSATGTGESGSSYRGSICDASGGPTPHRAALAHRTAVRPPCRAHSTDVPSTNRPPRRPQAGRKPMKIFQPMLFVGLGGTGGLVGAELERKLRAELCGPDGVALGRLSGHAPYQLPDCLQFVYADYSESDLQRLPQFNVDPSLRAAYSRTSRATHNLLPNFDASPELTKMLRASLRDEVADWLPPRIDEPKVTPLHNGAGQLPTVGRAALFATLRHSLARSSSRCSRRSTRSPSRPVNWPSSAAARSTACDVFVAFSVAGGTGAGIFLDYLHLINHAFQLRRFDGVKIYPLVVMPSSFSSAGGGGREAELNAARALVDLFRLVDAQNAPSEGTEIGDLDLDLDSGLGIRYRAQQIRLRTGILPTAFLFSPTARHPPGRPAPLHRLPGDVADRHRTGRQPPQGPGHGDRRRLPDLRRELHQPGRAPQRRVPTGIGRPASPPAWWPP